MVIVLKSLEKDTFEIFSSVLLSGFDYEDTFTSTLIYLLLN